MLTVTARSLPSSRSCGSSVVGSDPSAIVIDAFADPAEPAHVHPPLVQRTRYLDVQTSRKSSQRRRTSRGRPGGTRLRGTFEGIARSERRTVRPHAAREVTR